MKFRGIGLAIIASGAAVFNSCFQPPEYAPVPAIEYESIIFKDITDPSLADSLIVTVRFKDGDGDLGLDATDQADNSAPYNNKNYLYLSNGTKVNYKTKRTNPSYFYLPSFINPYNCTNWEITTVSGKTDTLYFDLNPNHNNIYVDYLIKNNDGSFKKFDWLTEFVYPNCGISYDGRFPRLYKDLTHKTPIEGSIRYAMTSVGFLILFSTKTLKLRVTIQDRSLHPSNIIETPEFTLQSIKKSG